MPPPSPVSPSPAPASPTSSPRTCTKTSPKQAFPTDTRQHVYIDGAIETAVGLGIASPKTRKFALIGLAVYLIYMLGNVARNR